MASRRQVLQLSAAFLLLPRRVFAQGEKRIARIGFLSAASGEANAVRLKVFQEALRELGWAEGRDYILELRFGNGAYEAIQRAAAELVAAKPDILIGAGDAAIRPLADRTRTIPIVFPSASDPVGSGYAASLQRPGKNLTGLTASSYELIAKRLQLLKEAFPHIAHVVMFYDPAEPATMVNSEQYELAAKQLKVRLTQVELSQGMELGAVFKRALAARPDAVVLPSAASFNIRREDLGARLASLKLPSIVEQSRIAEAGALIAYAPPELWGFRRMATYVDKILKGAQPAEMPIEQPTQFQLVVNARAAKAMGIKLPTALLIRADRVLD